MPVEVEIYPVRSERRSPLRAILPEEGTARFDPFLVVHEQGPVSYPPHRAIGFPEHPHRGIETITYIVRGAQYHCDSFGHRGVLEAGDVQWMSAAAGIIHSELPSERIFENGGDVHAFQVWLNLPRDRKMEPPRYQDIRAADVPVIAADGSRFHLLAGEVDGRRSPIECGRPFLMMHAHFDARASSRIAVPSGSTVIVYAIAGTTEVDGAMARTGEVAIARERDEIVVRAPEAAEALVLAAQPIGEPVVSRGPFVMTSEDEIERAYRDLIDGRFGHPARTQ
jgi:redox-sensitive bicupin YhaK (pirin superfamily)